MCGGGELDGPLSPSLPPLSSPKDGMTKEYCGWEDQGEHCQSRAEGLRAKGLRAGGLRGQGLLGRYELG